MSLGRIHHIDISEDTVSESLEKVKERTTTERITLDYIDFMKDIWETNKGEV